METWHNPPLLPHPSTPIRRVGYTAWRLPSSTINKYVFPPPPPPLPSLRRAEARNCGGRDRVSAIKKRPLSALTFVPAIIIPGGISSSPVPEGLRGKKSRNFRAEEGEAVRPFARIRDYKVPYSRRDEYASSTRPRLYSGKIIIASPFR